MVVSNLLTSVLNARANPVQVVAEAVIAITPGPVAESLIRVVGRNDKPFLVAGVTVGILALSALAGVLTRRRSLYGHLVFWAMAAVAVVATMTRPDFSPHSLLPLAAGVVVWTVLLDLLTGTAEPRPTLAASRRRFLLSAGGVAVAAVAVGVGGRVVGRSRRAVEGTRRLLRLPVTRGTVPVGADLGVPGTPSGGSPTTASTGSTPRWWCPPSTPTGGGCGSTGWSTGRSRSPIGSWWPAGSPRTG